MVLLLNGFNRSESTRAALNRKICFEIRIACGQNTQPNCKV
jgi:hypothetical protein